MFLRILKNDFKRKKVMNIVLFVFICISTALLSSSVAVLYQSMNAVPIFQEKSNTADYNFTLPYSSQVYDDIEEWIKGNDEVESYDYLQAITLPKGFAFSDGIDISNGNGTYLMKQSMHVNYVFDEAGERIQLASNEIALPTFLKGSLDLEVGDTIHLVMGNIKQDFVFKTYIKDSFLGNAMIGNARYLVSDELFDELANKVSDEQKSILLMSSVKGDYKIINDYIEQGFPSYLALHKDTLEMAFLGSTISMSMILMLASGIFIIIATMTLRFAIVTTLEEEYREIGIMKAIGMSHNTIRNLYIARYIGQACLGCAIGFVLGLPLTNVFNQMGEEMMVIETSLITYVLSLLTAVGVALFIIMIALLVLRKIRACTTMKAIKGGQGDERFKKERFPLYKQKRGSMVNLLAFHDVIQNAKTFLVLASIVILTYLLMVISISLKDVVKGKQMMNILGFSVADMYTESKQTVMSFTEAEALKALVEEELHTYDTSIEVYAQYMDTMQIKEEEIYQSVLANKQAIYQGDDDYRKGVAPKLKNEIAISEVIMENLNKHVGDQIHMMTNGKEEEFIITGVFSAMINTGYSIRLSPAYELQKVTFSQYAIYLKDEGKEAMIQDIIGSDSMYHYQTAEDVVSVFTSGFTSYMDMGIMMLIGLVLTILMLITILFTRLQVLQNRGNIAIMKSIGIGVKQIQNWQIRRIMLTVIASILPGILIFMGMRVSIFNTATKIMGLQKLGFHITEMQIDCVIVYLLCPFLILLVAYIFTRLSTSVIHHVKIDEMKED